MTMPLVAVLSRNTDLGTQLGGHLSAACRLTVAGSVSELLQGLHEHRPDAILLDFSHAQGNGHAEARLVEQIADCADLDPVVITADECPEPLERFIVEQHFPHARASRLTDAAALVLEQLRLPVPPAISQSPTSAAGTSGRAHDPAILHGLTRRFETGSPRLKNMLAELEIAARHNVTILLIGETGSGKTFLSRLIHEISPRRNEPFLHVACGALPGELIESELFGHVKGAFTSAHADKEGKFVAAAGGTILLDEIDVLQPEQQVKLLRAIETGEFEPVGSNRTLKSRARLVVASNLQLQPLVDEGRFRPDLYYRLNMLKFEVPPLRERKEDIIPLADKFIRQMTEKHGIEILKVEQSLYDSLVAYPWPGNVRELENVVQRAVIFCRDGRLSARQLPSHIVSGFAGPTNDPTVRLASSEERPAKRLDRQIAFTEREIIEQALFRNNCSRTNTARDLGISRVTLYNKMKKYGILQ